MALIRRKWKPHAAQRVIRNDGTRFRICVCGRRFGKTEMCHHEAIEYALTHENAHIWWVAPTFGDANELGFDPMIEDIIPPALIDGEPKRSAPREFSFKKTGSTISFRSAERMDSLRGRGLDLLIIDEAGSTPDRAWKAELRPSLVDTGGAMIAIGTPRGRNWFFEWFQRGQDEEIENTQSFRFTTYDNPTIPEEEIEESRAELPERVFKREYLAKFLEDEGAVFGNVRERNAKEYDLESAIGSAPFTIGVDLGRTKNFTAIDVLDQHGTLVHSERLRGGSWSGIGDAIKRVHERYSPSSTFLDSTRDNALIQNLQRDGVAVEPVRFTAQKKNEMVENLAARLELGEIVLSEDAEQLIAELEAFEFETTKAGNIRYTAPAGTHDDHVDALALAANQPEVASATW